MSTQIKTVPTSVFRVGIADQLTACGGEPIGITRSGSLEGVVISAGVWELLEEQILDLYAQTATDHAEYLQKLGKTKEEA